MVSNCQVLRWPLMIRWVSIPAASPLRRRAALFRSRSDVVKQSTRSATFGPFLSLTDWHRRSLMCENPLESWYRVQFHSGEALCLRTGSLCW